MEQAFSTSTGASDSIIRELQQRLTNEYFVGQSISLEPAPFSSTHPCFLVSVNQAGDVQKYLVKYLLQHNALLNGVALQIDIQQHLASLGVAVELLYVADDYQYLVMPYIASSNWAQLKKLSLRDKSNALSQQLVMLHQLEMKDVALQTLDVPKVLQQYKEQTTVLTAETTTVLDSVLDKIEHWWQAQLAEHSLRFCHIDLSLSHLIGERQIKLVDWEYASLCLPLYDIAMCIAINQFSQRVQHWLLEDYLMLTGQSHLLNEYQGLLEVHLDIAHLCNQLWYLAAEQVSCGKNANLAIKQVVARLSNKLESPPLTLS